MAKKKQDEFDEFDAVDAGEVEEGQDGDNMTIDLADVDETKTGFDAMPKGEYECIVDDCEFGPSKNTGAPMITWKFKVVSDEYQNRVLFYHNVLNKTFGVALLKKTIIALGLETDLKNFKPAEFAANGDAIGLPIKVKVGIQTYEGQKRNTVKDVSPVNQGEDFI